MIHAAWIHFYGNIFIIFKFLQLSIFSKEFWQFFRLRLRFQTQGRSRSFIGGSSLIHWIIDSDVDDHLNYFEHENNSYRHQVAVDLAQTFSAGSVVVSVSFIGLMIFASRGALQSKLIIQVEPLYGRKNLSWPGNELRFGIGIPRFANGLLNTLLAYHHSDNIFYTIWLGRISKNFKIFIFKPNFSFLKKNHKNDNLGEFSDFHEVILYMIF